MARNGTYTLGGCGNTTVVLTPDAPIDGSPFTQRYHLYPLGVCASVFGWMHPLQAVICLAVTIFCAYRLNVLRTNSGPGTHKIVFALATAAFATSFAFNFAGMIETLSIRTHGDAFHFGMWCTEYVYSGGLAVSMLTGFADVALAFFWARDGAERRATKVQVALVAFIAAFAVGALSVDSVYFHRHLPQFRSLPLGPEMPADRVWQWSIVVIGTFALIAIICHLYCLVQWWRRWGSLRHHHPVVRPYLTRASIIGVVTVAVCGFNLVVAAGKLTNVRIFEVGALSVNNPTFMLLLIGIIVPARPFVIAVAFYGMWRRGSSPSQKTTDATAQYIQAGTQRESWHGASPAQDDDVVLPLGEFLQGLAEESRPFFSGRTAQSANVSGRNANSSSRRFVVDTDTRSPSDGELQ